MEGVIYDIGNLTASDVRVYPDISKVTTAGVHTVELKGEVEDGDKNISIESISPASIQIKFDSLETVTMDIKARLSGYSAPAKDYLIRDVSVSPSNVELTGPAEDIARISFHISNEQIEVAGPAEAIDRYKEIPLGQVDLRTLDIGMTESFAVELPTGFVNTQNIQSVLVQLNSEGMVSKNFNVSTILVNNVPLNYQATATTQEIPNVKVVGPQSIVENLVAGDIVATVDLEESSSIASGQIELPVKISIPKKGLVWASGSYKAIISIAEQNGSQTTTEDATEQPQEPQSEPTEQQTE